MKKAVQQIQDTPDDASTIRIIKSGSCTNLSGKSQLEYHIGSEANGEVYFRVSSNSGGGFFSPEWISLKGIQVAFQKAPKPITSFALWPLFKGKSSNSPGFLFAALLAEGLVEHDKENPRVYVALSPDSFRLEMTKLIAEVGNGVMVDDVPTLNATTSPSKLQKKKA